MWGLGFLLLIGIFVVLITLLLHQIPAKARPILTFLSVLIPVSFPFWYHIYPSYGEFQSLCQSDDRIRVIKIVPVDVVHEDSGCYNGIEALKKHNYKGFTCQHGAYQRGASWNTEQCQNDCPPQRDSIYSVQQKCIKHCLDEYYNYPKEFVHFTHDYNYKRTELIKGRLIQNERSLVTDKFGVMATSINYRYYQYGNGFAKILGLSSGTAPSIECPTKVKINVRSIFPAKK